MFSFPPLNNVQPIWTGHGFRVGEQNLRILSYTNSEAGWTNDLTAFHEDTAGTSHFIDRASRTHALTQVAKYNRISNAAIMDIGCSSGFMVRDLRRVFPSAFVMGSDVVRPPLDRLSVEIPDLPLLHFDLVQCPLLDDSLDAAILLNVLEHIEDDEAALRQVWRILKPDGIAIIEVPAGPKLYDVYDRMLMHFRRYKLQNLKRSVHNAGFKILDHSHLGFFIYPGFNWVKKRNQKRLKQSEDKTIVSQNIKDTQTNPILENVMRLELALGRWISYPFGIRCLITVQKPINGAVI
jgi:2-polyprenyl-3-methyl-5-hydroxy-6-metoxy-1,4-benzoquinol methylase